MGYQAKAQLARPMGAASGEPSDELAQAALAQAAVVEEAALVEEQHAGLGVQDEP